MDSNADYGYADIAEMLISQGADPNLISDTERTQLEIAKAMDYMNLFAAKKASSKGISHTFS